MLCVKINYNKLQFRERLGSKNDKIWQNTVMVCGNEERGHSLN